MRLTHIFLVLAGLFFVAQPSMGQQQNWTSSNGVLQLIDWPYSIEDQRTIDSLRVHSTILPSIDTLSIGYGYKIIEDEPALSFALDWKPGADVLFDGETVDWSDLEGDLLIESIQVRVDVLSQDTIATLVDFVVDSLMLEPYPGLFSEVVTNLTWDTVFPDLPDTTARQLFDDGFSLANPELTHITFAYFGGGELAGAVDMPPVRPRRPSRRTIYGPGIDIYVGFPVHINRPRPQPERDDPTRAREPRGEQIGRGDTTDDDRPRNSDDGQRSGGGNDGTDRGDRADRPEAEDVGNEGIFDRSGKKKEKKKDDEEEDEELLGPALAGVAAVALVGAAGGTVGYYGNTEHAPIGLTSGYVETDWGILLQVAVNSAVIERSDSEEEHFLGKITWFYNMFDSPIQPSIGLGVLASELNGSFDYEFSASVGVVGNFGSLLVLGGYDIAAGGADIGIAYNFKAKK